MSVSEEKATAIFKSSEFNEKFWTAATQHHNAGNFIASLCNISLLMGLVRLGAKGKTREEIQRAFAFPSTDTDLTGAFGKLIDSLKTSSGCQIEFATAMFAKNDCKFKPNFMTAAKLLEAEARIVDFSKSSQAADEINGFVDSMTKNKITSIVASSDLNDLTHLVLVSAIYLKGKWKSKFNPENTSKRPFTNKDGKQTNVDMMFQRIKCPHVDLRNVGARAISLPYEGDRVKMIIVLPDKPNGLEELQRKLEPQFFRTVASKLNNNVDVQLYLPKFKATAEIDLKPIFKQLKMPSMFEDRNELGGYFENSPNLFVSKILHKAYIEVNEEGSEAAAATVAVMMMRSMPIMIEFMANRPFLYYIFDEKLSVVLFAGSQVEF